MSSGICIKKKFLKKGKPISYLHISHIGWAFLAEFLGTMILCNSWKMDSHHSVWGKRESDLDTHLKKKLHLLLLYYTKGIVEQRIFISLYYLLVATSAIFSKSLAHHLLLKNLKIFLKLNLFCWRSWTTSLRDKSFLLVWATKILQVKPRIPLWQKK